MKKYETIFILDPDLEETQAQATIEKVKGIITQADGAELFKIEDWGKRKLAYPIRHLAEGYYVLVKFKSKPALCKQLEANLEISEEVLRYLVVRSDS